MPSSPIAVAQMDCTVGEIEPNLNKIRRLAADRVRAGRPARHLSRVRRHRLLRRRQAERARRLPRRRAIEGSGRHRPVRESPSRLRPSSRAREVRSATLNRCSRPRASAWRRTTRRTCLRRSGPFASRGNNPVVVDTALGRIGMTICYDLMFSGVHPEPDRPRRGHRHQQHQLDPRPLPARLLGLEPGAHAGPGVHSRARERRLRRHVLPGRARGGRPPTSRSTALARPAWCRRRARSWPGSLMARAWRSPHVDISESELDRWRGIATYRIDRRPELYR